MSGLSQIKLTESCVPCIMFSTPGDRASFERDLLRSDNFGFHVLGMC